LDAVVFASVSLSNGRISRTLVTDFTIQWTWINFFLPQK
jgi:hypothetical protein